MDNLYDDSQQIGGDLFDLNFQVLGGQILHVVIYTELSITGDLYLDRSYPIMYHHPIWLGCKKGPHNVTGPRLNLVSGPNGFLSCLGFDLHMVM